MWTYQIKNANKGLSPVGKKEFMSRKILVTNDDGIRAHGIVRLAEAAKEFGEVWVVAPDAQRSAASHAITLHDPIDVLPFADFPVEGVRAFSCSGTPADCVRVGSLYVMPEKPELVLSGINHGYNAASDIQYSGTVGAAFEAAFQGARAIAVSEGTGECLDVTNSYLPEILRELIDRDSGPDRVWNINFPTCALEECRGILRDREVSHGMFYKDHYIRLEELPGKGARVMVEGVRSTEAEPGTDMRALVDNYISIGIVSNVGYGN